MIYKDLATTDKKKKQLKFNVIILIFERHIM